MTTRTKSNARPMGTPTIEDDAGPRALAQVHQRLLIDEEWTDRRDRGFTWWAHRLEQRIDAGLPIDDDGIVITRLTSRIPVVTNVRATPERVERILAASNLLADSYSYVYDPQTQQVDSVQSGIVHAQTLDWRPDLLASYFVIQLIHAEQDANRLARALRGRIARSRHPMRGQRREPDDMLNVVDAVFLPSGVPDNPFANEFEFESICEQVNRINAVSLGASSTGVAIEVPFADSTALITLDAQYPHPRLGRGLGVRLHLPTRDDFDEGARLAAWLNRKDAAGDLLCPAMGAWTVRGDIDPCRVVRCAFISAALWRSGLAMDVAAGAILTLRKLNTLLDPDGTEPNASEVLANRLALRNRNSSNDDESRESARAARSYVHNGVTFVNKTLPGRSVGLVGTAGIRPPRRRRLDS